MTCFIRRLMTCFDVDVLMSCRRLRVFDFVTNRLPYSRGDKFANAHAAFANLSRKYRKVFYATYRHLLFKNILSDLLDAFEKLDLDGKLPAIYCEANNLSLLPSLEPDPVSRQLALNTKAIESLSISVKDTSSGNVQPLVDKVSSSISSGYDSLKALVESAQRIKAEVESSVEAAMKKLSSLKVAAPHRTISDQSIPILQRTTPRVPTSYPDRRLNVIIFGLPEEDSLKKTKEVVDQLLHYITGKSVLWKDAFCLGRRKSTASTSSMVPPPPRPLLVKLCSEWDKRLILSAKHKLKDYDVQNVFLREDLPFDVRQSRAKSRQNRLSRLSHTQPPPSSTMSRSMTMLQYPVLSLVTRPMLTMVQIPVLLLVPSHDQQATSFVKL